MRKSFNKVLLFAALLFLLINKVYAFDYDSINISNKIKLPILQTNSDIVEIRLNENLKENNTSIYYQFIETTENTISYYETESSRINSTYDACKNTAESESNYKALKASYLALEESLGEGYEENQEYKDAKAAYSEAYNNYISAHNICVSNYNSSYNELMKIIPTYVDSDWQGKTIDEEKNSYLIYNVPVPKNANYYWLWVKAKDEEGTDIYQVVEIINHSEEPSSQTEEPSSNIEEPSSNIEEPSSQIDYSSNNDEDTENPKTGYKSLLILLPILLILSALLIKYKFFDKSKISNL